MKKNISKYYCLAVAIICLTTFTYNISAQQTPKPVAAKTQTKDNTCGCEYFPLCNWEETKKIAGKTYKGYADEQGEMVWYNCDNGIVTKKWTITYYPESESSSYNPFLNETTVYRNTGPAQKELVTMEILNSNLPEGGSWSYEETYGNWFTNIHYFTIEKKGLKIKADNITYTDVIKVRYSTKSNEIINGLGVFSYYAKGKGLVKEERETQNEKKEKEINTAMPQVLKLEKLLIADGTITGVVEKELFGKWVLTEDDKADLILNLFENGTGVMYREVEGSQNIFLGMLNAIEGKNGTGNTFLFWRIDNGLKIIFLDEDLLVNRVKTHPLTRMVDPRTKKPAIKISNDTYISVTKKHWEQPLPEAKQNTTETNPVTNLKGSIDRTLVGVWKHNKPEGNGDIIKYTFYENGTYQFYHHNNKAIPGISEKEYIKTGHWRVDGNFLEILENGKTKNERINFSKKNDNKTGNPKIVIRYLNLVDIEYESQDNKKPW